MSPVWPLFLVKPADGISLTVFERPRANKSRIHFVSAFAERSTDDNKTSYDKCFHYPSQFVKCFRVTDSGIFCIEMLGENIRFVK